MRSTVPPVAPPAVPVPVPVLQWMRRIPPVMPTYRLINVGIAACCVPRYVYYVVCVSTFGRSRRLVPIWSRSIPPPPAIRRRRHNLRVVESYRS